MYSFACSFASMDGCLLGLAQDERIEALRHQIRPGYRIAQQTSLSRATVSRILGRLKLNRIRDPVPAPVYPRYEHIALRWPATSRHQESGTHRVSRPLRDRKLHPSAVPAWMSKTY